ncbi:MAG: hypothetical protein WCW01_04580 [Gammaproteobacteria bacterium]
MSSYLTSIILQYIPSKPVQQPRERYVNYMQDLYKLFGDQVTEESFLEGSQCAYTEIGDVLFNEAKKMRQLVDIDMFVINHWAHEFDPEYAACGPYFLYTHKFDCNHFDICDQGTIGILTALKIISQYQYQCASKNAVLLVMEQTTVPRNKFAYDPIPILAGGALFWIDSNPKSDARKLRIIAIDFIHQAEVIEKGWNALATIQEVCRKFQIAEENLSVFVSKSSFAYKSLQYALDASWQKQGFVLRFMDHLPGMLPFAKVLQSFMHNEKACTKYSLLFQEDAESAEIGYLLLGSGV